MATTTAGQLMLSRSLYVCAIFANCGSAFADDSKDVNSHSAEDLWICRRGPMWVRRTRHRQALTRRLSVNVQICRAGGTISG